MYRIKLVRFKAHNRGDYIGTCLYVIRFYNDHSLMKSGLFYGGQSMYDSIMDYIYCLEDLGVDAVIKERTKYWSIEEIKYYQTEARTHGHGYRLKPALLKQDIHDVMNAVKEVRVEQQQLFV